MATKTSTPAGRKLVWDLPTRVFHWALALSFAGAYLLAEEDGARGLHVMFGYTVLGLVAFRILWGFVGSRASRFASFAYGPRAALGYLRDLAKGRARDYEGHNPAGSWGIYALLSLALATAATGWLNLNGVGGEEAFEEIHETFANAWLVLVVVHLAGVLVSSLAHRRNLAASMVTGRVPESVPAGEPGAVAGRRAPMRPRWALGSALAAAIVGFWAWAAANGGQPLLAGTAAAQHAAQGEADHDGHDDD